jgi:thioester reductase-like protein
MSSTTAAQPCHVERFLQHRVAEIAGVAASSVSLNTTLSRLGMDSLGMLRLVESVECEFGAELPHSLCLDRLTIQSLAQALAAAPAGDRRTALDLAQQIAADCELPQDIRPPGGVAPPASPQSILLTGATGFLGAFLLRSLLHHTNAQIVCLARPNKDPVDTRIRRNLEQYGIWDDEFGPRIAVFEADITQPRLGLSPHSFDVLAGAVDVVFHAAASVNWVQPYARLRHANVLAVRELLRLACLNRPKPFHLISSLAVCYSTSGSREVLETDDVSADIPGVHLGYGQSKCAAESLARIAAQRGLPVSIFRPALISGDSLSGSSNTADFISELIKGCVQMGAAPDLDWLLDLLPVDFAAEAITRLVFDRNPERLRTFHLANPKLRHWRELILWMNLYGYRIELLRYEDWLDRLKAGVLNDNQHPLRDLLPFFLYRPPGQNGLYLPQLYEESRRRRVRFDLTRELLRQADVPCPRLSAGLLDRYFESFVDRQFLPPVQRFRRSAEPADQPPQFDVCFFRSLIGPDVTHAHKLEWSGSHSVIGELTSWKYGRSIGLHAWRLEFGQAPHERDVVVKVKARDAEVTAVGQVVAELCSPALGKAYERFSDCLGLSGSDTRELAIYRTDDVRFRRFSPRFYGGRSDNTRTVLVLENLSGLEMMDSIDSVPIWHPKYIEAAIEGIAQLHAIQFAQQKRPFRQPYTEARELWAALAGHAGPIFSQWIGPEIRTTQSVLLDRLHEFRRLADGMPQTLIHNDFNPRNLGFRRSGSELRVCLYDWELATIDLPQHDLAELLCFVVGVDVGQSALLRYIEMHRKALQDASGIRIDESSWALGFCLSLYDLMINRLPAYAMIHRFSEQRFLERVIRTWKGIFDVVSCAIHQPL